MPHTKSAAKRLRQSEKRRRHNRAILREIKELTKRVKALAKTRSDLEALEKETRLAIKKIDKAGARRVLHPNAAARRKSQLAQLLHQAKTAPQSSGETKT
ncbi:MAG: 30S ribosomal protein S20 [Gemmatales bacterium]|nr:30S ribosomal protein S20 [Gemmatales bacterium]MDW8387881.1 30S ribosomal protein S20 [Gemmatales bacterium]